MVWVLRNLLHLLLKEWRKKMWSTGILDEYNSNQLL